MPTTKPATAAELFRADDILKELAAELAADFQNGGELFDREIALQNFANRRALGLVCLLLINRAEELHAIANLKLP